MFGFKEYDELCRGCQGYSDNLAQLFDTCDNGKWHRHKILFKQALKRLRIKVKDTFESIKVQSSRNVTDFIVGKTFVKQKTDVSFDPMNIKTWSLYEGVNDQWHSCKADGFDGLVVIGCIERDLIPDDVIQYSKSMNQQMYTLGLEQALIQYYTLYKPDARLRNKLYSTSSFMEESCKGGAIYVAYKLEPDHESENTKDNAEEKQGAIERLRLLLKERGLYFQKNNSFDSDSFFMACANQLRNVGITQMDETSLRTNLVKYMKQISLEKLQFANFTIESFNEYLDRISNDEENDICNFTVETMAKMLDRKIVIYSLTYPDEVHELPINVQAENKEPSLLIAREKSCFKSLIREDYETSPNKQHEIKEAYRQIKRPAANVPLDNELTSGKTRINIQSQFQQIEPTDGVNTSFHPAKKAKVQDDKLRPANEYCPSTGLSVNIAKVKIENSDDTKDYKNATVSNDEPSSYLSAQTYHKAFVTNNLSDELSATTSKTQNSTYSDKLFKKTRTHTFVKMTNEEKILILNCYIEQGRKSDWDVLTETVYNQRRNKLNVNTIDHYGKKLTRDHLKQRIKSFVQDVIKGKREKEKDPSVIALMKQIVQN